MTSRREGYDMIHLLSAVYFDVNMIHELNNISLIILKYKQLKYHYYQNIPKRMHLKYIYTPDVLTENDQICMFISQMNHKLSIKTGLFLKSLVVFLVVYSL